MCRAERYETSIEKLMWLPLTLPPGPDGVQPPPQLGGNGPVLLLSCGGDGMIRVWQITTVGKLVCTLPGAQVRVVMAMVWGVLPPHSSTALAVPDSDLVQ